METPEVRTLSLQETTPKITQRNKFGVSRLIRNAALGVLIATGTGACTSTDVNKFLQPASSSPAQASETASPTVTSETVPNITISDKDSDINLQRLTKEYPAAPSDIELRNKLIVNLREKMGIPASEPVEGDVFNNGRLRVTYASDPDEFMAEITPSFDPAGLTNDQIVARFEQEVQTDKQFYENLLRIGGFTNHGIVYTLHLTYFVSKDWRNSLPPDVVPPFNPNPAALQLVEKP